MAVLTSLLLAALAGLSQAVPTVRANVPKPQYLSLSAEEFAAWAVNATQVLEPPTSGPVQERNLIIGTDDRYVRANKDFPWSAIGRLYTPFSDGISWSTNTGVLVGPRLMLTSKGVLNNDALYYEFSPGFNQNNVYPTAYATLIVTIDRDFSNGPVECPIQDGWALMVLSQPLGTQRGFFKVGDYMAEESSLSGKNIFYAAGYPHDKTTLAESNELWQSDGRTTSLREKSVCKWGGPIAGDVDNGDENGGPLWVLTGSTRTVYGTFASNVQQKSPPYAGYAGGPEMYAAVNQLNSQNPN